MLIQFAFVIKNVLIVIPQKVNTQNNYFDLDENHQIHS